MANAEEQHQENQRKQHESCERKKRESEATNRKIHARWRAIARGQPQGQERRPQ